MGRGALSGLAAHYQTQAHCEPSTSGGARGVPPTWLTAGAASLLGVVGWIATLDSEPVHAQAAGLEVFLQSKS
jgi:hypothetical protein